jgi:rRNA small subunit pseudouridine methyltransferase Nep1
LVENVVIIEQASLELLPTSVHKHKSAKAMESKFGIIPSRQILDDNFHHEAITHLEENEKRGRPDVLHFALLDITSTPLYATNKVSVVIHTWGNETIWLKEGVRVPRTLLRFNGLVSKILSNEVGKDESRLFNLRRSQLFDELLEEIRPSNVVSLTKIGKPTDLREFLSHDTGLLSQGKNAWIVGGFAFGHFQDKVIESSDHVISISSYPLPSHVVTARLTYELERALMNSPQSQR